MALTIANNFNEARFRLGAQGADPGTPRFHWADSTDLGPTTPHLQCDGQRDAVSQYLQAIVRLGPVSFAPNLPPKAFLLVCGRLWLPVLLTNPEDDLAWVCSLKKYYVDVLGHHLHNRGRSLRRRALDMGRPLAAWLFDAAGLGKCAYVNHWLFSTNPIPNVLADIVDGVTQAVVSRFPDHAVVIKSVNDIEHPNVLTALHRAGYEILPHRTVYIARHDPDAKRRGHAKADLRKRKHTSYVLVGNDADYDYERVADLFRWVYLDRYAHTYHPKFNASFFALAHRSGLVDLFGFVRGDQLSAFAMTLVQDGVMHVPCLGHDPKLAKLEALYRLTFSEVMTRASLRGLPVNWSGGAGDFKRKRGCVPAMEYVAVWGRHLSLRKRGAIHLLTKASRNILGGAEPRGRDT